MVSGSPRARLRVVLIALAVVLAGGVVVYAVPAAIDDAATVAQPAVRAEHPPGDLVVIFDVGDVDRFVVEASGAAADRVGGTAAPGRSGSLGMERIMRGGSTMHAPPAGYLVPTVFVSLPRGAVAGVMGSDVSAVLDRNSVVMNEMTAEITGAREGDVIVVQARNGSPVALTVAGIRPYEQLGWAELVFTTQVAERLGFVSDTRVVIWGVDDRDGLDAALADAGVIGRKDTKVNRSWDPPDPDDTISTVRTKVALGEPWYRLDSSGSISMHPTWKQQNLTDGRVLLNETVRVRAQCHQLVVDDFRAAFADVVAAGLAAEIEVANANAYGGCFVPRYSRTSGFLSRHTYGMAFDTNTTSNCAGCRPRMSCDVVRIFRKHGFAWGGNFRRPDGMHFEWVGEPRDQISYPSRYCPNIVNPLVQSAAPAEMGAAVLTAGGADIVHEHTNAP